MGRGARERDLGQPDGDTLVQAQGLLHSGEREAAHLQHAGEGVADLPRQGSGDGQGRAIRERGWKVERFM